MNYDDETDRRPTFPVGARVAGIIWIVVGVIGIVGTLANFALGGGMANPRVPANQQAAFNAGQTCGAVFAFLIYIVFLVAGVTTVQGKAKGLTGNGIGSIVFSLLFFCGGGVGLAAALGAPAGAGRQEMAVLMFAMGFVLLFGLGLLLAGILAVSSKVAYQDWREAEGLARPRSRRRRDDDHPDDYDDRRRRRDDDEYDDRRRDDY